MNYLGHVAQRLADRQRSGGGRQAACESIVKERMCQSGMRWKQKGGRDILALRVLVKSKQWESAWAAYHASQWLNAARE